MQQRPILILLALVTAIASARPTSPLDLYPNELPNLKFYAKYLSPLRPYRSDRASVISVFGTNEVIEPDGWLIRPFFVGEEKDSTVKPEYVGRLASISIRPKQRVSMPGVRFPQAFTHSLGTVSEINASCDVYTDRFGLQYWIYSENSRIAKKGDLMEIEYGASEDLERQANREH